MAASTCILVIRFPLPLPSLATKTDLSAMDLGRHRASSRTRAGLSIPFVGNEPRSNRNPRTRERLEYQCVKGHEFFPRLYLAREEEHRTSCTHEYQQSTVSFFFFFFFTPLSSIIEEETREENFKVRGKNEENNIYRRWSSLGGNPFVNNKVFT